jgi:hypothetical protein
MGQVSQWSISEGQLHIIKENFHEAEEFVGRTNGVSQRNSMVYLFSIISFLLVMLSFILPWYFHVVTVFVGGTPYIVFWFLWESMSFGYSFQAETLFPAGPLVGGGAGILVSISLYRWAQKSIKEISPSLTIFNMMFLPWVGSPSIDFLVGRKPGIIITGGVLSEGILPGFIINVMGMSLLIIVIVLGVIYTEPRVKGVPYRWLENLLLLLLGCVAFLIVFAGSIPWSILPIAGYQFPIFAGITLFLIVILTFYGGVREVLGPALIGTGGVLAFNSAHWILFSAPHLGHNVILLGPVILLANSILLILLGWILFLIWCFQSRAK